MSSPALIGGKDRVRRGFHESAHAVVGHALGFRIREAGVDADFDGPSTGGYCATDHRPLTAHNLRAHLAFALAGYVGDRLLEDGAWFLVDLRNVLDREKGRSPERGTGREWGDWVRLVARLNGLTDWLEAEELLKDELQEAARDVVSILQHFEHAWHALAARLELEGTVALRGWKPTP